MISRNSSKTERERTEPNPTLQSLHENQEANFRYIFEQFREFENMINKTIGRMFMSYVQTTDKVEELAAKCQALEALVYELKERLERTEKKLAKLEEEIALASLGENRVKLLSEAQENGG